MNAVLVEKIRELCRRNPKIKSITRLEEMLRFGNGSIGKWAKSEKSPPHDRLVKIAATLGVSVSDLTGEGQKNSPLPDGKELSDLEYIRSRLPHMSKDDLAALMAELPHIFMEK